MVERIIEKQAKVCTKRDHRIESLIAMLSILDRYIGRSILVTSLLVLLVLVALASIFAFVAELEDVGKGSYSLGKAMQYVLLTIPSKAYLLFAPAVLLGSLLGLGALATYSELIVMRAAGVSNSRIIRSVLIAGLALMLAVGLLGEFAVPKAEQVAEQIRLTALEKRVSVRGNNGLWVKSDSRFVNISTVMPNLTLLGVVIWEYNDNNLSRSLKVEKAEPVSEGWKLSGLDITEFTDRSSSVKRIEEEVWPSLVSARVLQALSMSPESLSLKNLRGQVDYLKNNGLDSERIELAFWIKLTSPLATLVMLMLSLPFVFGSQRSGGAGQKIFIGIMLGIGYVLVNKLLTHLGLTYGFSPAFSALLPLALFFCISIVGIQNIS